MNSMGRFFRTDIFGESHGEALGILIDGCPAGIDLDADDLAGDLGRRRGGKEGTTARVETDAPRILSGIFEGRTTGAPILIVLDNTEQNSGAYDALRYTPRPGHADFTAFSKYGGYNDHRGGGHFSGRLTAGLVAAGAIAKKIIAPATPEANLVEAGGSRDIEGALRLAIADGDSVGGIVECRVSRVPAGLGEPFFEPMESLISHAIFAIPAVKGIEFGAGFAAAAMRGSRCNDEIMDSTGTTRTNNAGGIAGGITNGNDIVFRVAVKPTPSIQRPQETIDVRDGGRVSLAIEGRHDLCIALRMPVIIEAVTAIVLADCMLMEQMVPRVWRKTADTSEAPEQDLKTLDGLLCETISQIPESAIFDEGTVTRLENITSRLEHLKHIIRDKDEEELKLFVARTLYSRHKENH